MFNFENLIVYQESLTFTSQIYSLSQKSPKDELFGLTNQLRRAVVSISLNIAEGSSRTKKDFKHFLNLSRGSCYEVATIIKIAKNLNYISEAEYSTHYETINRLSKMINSLKNSIK